MKKLKPSAFIAGKRCLVTGGAGFIGQHLAEKLCLDHNANVGILSRSASQREIVNLQNIETMDCDLRDLDLVSRCVNSFKPDMVFHFAAHPDSNESFEQVINALETNAKGTLNVLEAFRLFGGKYFIYGDSCKVFGNSTIPYNESTPLNPLSSYAIAKAVGWQYCKLYQQVYNLNVVSIRPTLVYGPSQTFNIITHVVNCAMQSKPITLLGGSQSRSPLYIEDATEAIIAIADRCKELNGRAINIGGSEEITIFELAKKILVLMQIEIPIIQNKGATRPFEMERSHSDNLDALELLNWRPKIDINTGLLRTISFLKENQKS